MNLDEKVRYIKGVKDENKLIIFVGAGISKNSNLPDWEQLIKVFIKKLNYPNREDEKLSSDEYLKIPQYYYNTYGKEEYEKVIKDELDIEVQPNDIHELIFKLNPSHIITTNYDRLLEDTIIEQRMLFDRVSKDKDLLDSKKSNHIIKMHGDIKDLENIVLKENDYLNYSQNHILIETYIKSLLVSNTFLFVGYSLNDYNLKQIISWVDYLAKSYTDIKDRPKSFIIQEVKEEYSQFVEDYYEKNNIFIINPKEIDNEYMKAVSSSLTNEFGKRLYGTLMYIKDYPNSIIDKLYYGAMKLKKMRKISLNDLLSIYRFKYGEVLGGNTFNFISSIDKNEYLILKEIIKGEGEKERLVKESFVKAGIRYINIRIDWNNTEKYDLLNNYNQKNDEFSELSILESNFNYIEIESRINSIDDKNIRAFYLFKLQRYDEARECLMELKQDILNKDIYTLLLYKFNLGLINRLMFHDDKGNYNDYRYIYENIAKKNMVQLNYLNDIFNDNKEQVLELSNLRDKHIKMYLKLDNSVQMGNIRLYLYKMMTIVYDYYFYIRENRIYLDYFRNMEDFFEPYIEAILSTYSPKTKRVRSNILFPDTNDYTSYTFNIYDLDIIIKYSNYKKIKEFLSEYQVKGIVYEDNIDIIEMLSNLCQYVKLKANRYKIEYLKKFMLVLTLVNLDEDAVNKIVKILEDVLINKNGILHVYIFTEIYKDLIIFIIRNSNFINNNSFELIINEVFTEGVYKQLEGENKTGSIFSLLKSIKPFSYNIYKKKIDEVIDVGRIGNILCFSGLFTEEQKENAKMKILENIDPLNIDTIIQFIFNDIIEYNEDIEKKILDSLEVCVSNKMKNPGVMSLPDPLQDTLDNVIVLFLMDKGVNISKFKAYIQYNDILKFILDSSNFDYAEIALDNYYWMNVMRNEKYLTIIIDKAKDIVNKKLKYNIDNGFVDEEQTRLYYKYFE